MPDRGQIEVVPRAEIDLGGVEVFDAADVAPHDARPQAPRRQPGGAQIVPNIRGRKAAAGPPVAIAVKLARPFQLLLVPGGGDGQDIAQAQASPAADIEFIAGGHVVALHLLNGQVVQQGHDVAAVIEVGAQPQVAAPPAFDLGALRGVAVETLVEDELRGQGADALADLDGIVVEAEDEAVEQAGRPHQSEGVGIGFLGRQARVAALEKVVLGGR